MSQFIESICFEKGEYKLPELHQERINKTFRKFFPLTIPFDLISQLPKLDFKGKHKVRMVYSNESIDVKVEKYSPKNILSLKIIKTPSIDYTYKHEDRKLITKLYSLRGASGDIIIVKNGFITDSSYANLVFWDGSKWYTPKSYLLDGVKRQFYLRYGLIAEKKISLTDIESFEKVSLINAMLDLGDTEIDVKDIVH